MPMYNLIEYSDNYSITSGSLQQYYRDEPHNTSRDSQLFKSKIKIAGNAPANGNTKNVEIAVPLKHLSNFWRTLEIPPIILKWSSTCVITNSTDARLFAITDAELYVSVVTLLTQDNAQLLEQLKSGFARTII